MSSLLSIVGSLHFQALCLILASAAAIQALIAIWAATSIRVPWFWRALAVWAAITALLPIRAYQPALVFAISSPLTIILIATLKPRVLVTNFHPGNTPLQSSPLADSQSPTAFRFSIRDLMLATVIVGLILASLTHLVPRLGHVNAMEFALATVAQITIPFLAWQSHASTRPRLARVLLIAALVAFTAGSYFIRRSVSSSWPLLGVLFEGDLLRGVFATWITSCELALILFFSIPLISIQPQQLRHAPRSRWLQITFVAMAPLWLAVLAVIYCQMLWLLPFPPPFSTAPTHHRRLMEISQRIRGLTSSTTSAARAERQALIDETVRLVDDDNYIPYNPLEDASLDAWNAFLMPSQLTRDLARALDADSADAQAAGDLDRACTLALANVRLGLMLRRGSTLIEYLIGTAIQGFTAKRLITARADVSPEQARRIITVLQQSLDQQENLNAIKYRDRVMAERAYGWAARLSNILDSAGLPSQIYLAGTIDEPQRRTATTVRLLQADLALRLYQTDHGALPERLGDLVPKYLPTVPLDPYSQQPLIYKVNGDSFLLYSVGLDQTDNGGNFTNATTYYSSRDAFNRLVGGYDYDLETNTRP